MTVSRGLARDLRIAQTELLATLREAVLLPRDLAPVVPPLAGHDDVVVLVHGLLATGGVFRPMRAHLTARAGVPVATFTYAPGMSIRSIAARLALVVDSIPLAARVHVIGHSLGGIVARDYVSHLGGHRRVAQTISLASPFHGTPRAARFSWFARDLHPTSEVLQAIRESPEGARVPHTSIVAGNDTLIPPASASLPGHPSLILPDRGHNSLLFDAEVVDLISALLKRSVAQRAA